MISDDLSDSNFLWYLSSLDIFHGTAKTSLGITCIHIPFIWLFQGTQYAKEDQIVWNNKTKAKLQVIN